MVNVMGDALATGIMAHICRKDFMKEGDGVSSNNPFKSSSVDYISQVITAETVLIGFTELSVSLLILKRQHLQYIGAFFFMCTC